MNRICPRIAKRRHQRLDVEVALFDRCRTDADRFIGRCDVKRRHVRVGEDGNRAKTESLRGPEHTAGDFPSVRDE
jgi:hypothetical protein